MRCLLPPHRPESFPTYSTYEVHYQQVHMNRCTECEKNFPTNRFLDLHIAENHDPITATRREHGEKIFACFVEGCEKVCRDWKKRRSHLVDKHGYPRNYDFLAVDHGIDGRRSMLRPGVDAQGHRKSSRERARSGSSVSNSTHVSEATSVSEHNGVAVSTEPEPVLPAASVTKNRKHSGVDANVTSIDDLTSSLSALKMVPRSVTFGQRKGRSGFAKS